ncbi:type II secretion system F family protein [Staphylococcus muscae]|uniref:Competence protein ComGB n=1 Tax=Staphylococcus muscae TaxID=1294 RepID=A0A240C5D4_9STAP|nr:competence type IV pilus assembly protein ComGB [Staphylococcus muscae]AVQ33085.1 type II secretion system F family protein [Staphylococcus muscae]PNZ01639.1 type II secretion system F family protein [Staphylococcus muscae]GGA88471.1 competence protein ComGB [Staphylococcus muscae]SNW02503.1 DNA transport machinery protein comGB [Staphylococcus muscae]
MRQLIENIEHRRTQSFIKSNHLLIIDRTCQLLLHGFTLIEAIQFIHQQLNIKDEKFNQQFLQTVVHEGSCYEIFKYLNYPDIILMQIYFAEKYSELSETLAQCYLFYANHLKLKAQFMKAIQYPFILLFIFLILILTLNHTVLPEFDHMYETMQIKRTFLQSLLKAFISHFPMLLTITLLTTLSALHLFKKWLTKQSMQTQIYVLTHIPIFKKYYRLFTTYQISQHFVLFFKNGITLNDIIKIYLSQNENAFLKYIGESLQSELQKGYPFSNILRTLNCFEDNFISYIEQGEQRDKLDVELMIYNRFLMDHIQSFITRHIKLIQPIMFLFIGLLIMGVYLEMMLPVFEMMQSIQQ